MARPRLGRRGAAGRTVGVRVTEAEAEELQERAQGGAALGGSLPAPADAGAAGADGSGAVAGPGTREAVERVSELVARLLAGETE